LFEAEKCRMVSKQVKSRQESSRNKVFRTVHYSKSILNRSKKKENDGKATKHVLLLNCEKKRAIICLESLLFNFEFSIEVTEIKSYRNVWLKMLLSCSRSKKE